MWYRANDPHELLEPLVNLAEAGSIHLENAEDDRWQLVAYFGDGSTAVLGYGMGQREAVGMRDQLLRELNHGDQ